MSRILMLCVLTLALPFFAKAQTITDTKTICKDSPIPEGYKIVGETDVKECPKQAWIVRKKTNPMIENSSSGRKPTPKMAQGSEGVNADSFDIEGEKQWKSLYQWQLFTPPGKDFSVLMPGKPFSKTSLEDGNRYTHYMVLAQRVLYLVSSGVATQVLRANMIKESDAAMKEIIVILKEKGIDSELFFDRPLNSNGFVGKQFRTISTSFPCLLRYYFKGKRFYFIAVLGSDEKDAQVNRFLTSFKLIKK